MMSGPARGRRRRVIALRALLPCLALIAFDDGPGAGPDADPGPVPPRARRLRRRRRIRRCAGPADVRRHAPAMPPTTRGCATRTAPAPSRIGAIPTYGLPAASGASGSGYDSLNRTRKKPKLLSGPGQAEAAAGSRQPAAAAFARRNGRVRLSVPPSESANKTPIPPAMAGTVAGQPPRKRLEDRRRSVRRGRRLRRQLSDQVRGRAVAAATTPIRGRTFVPQGSPFYVIAPEFLAVSDWERHALVADLRGSFTGYGNTFPPPTDGTHLVGADRYRPAGFHRPYRRPSRRQPATPA